MCAAPSSIVKIPSTGLTVMNVCPNTLSLGGRSVQGSTFCSAHLSVDDGSGCRKESNVTK